MGSEMCIRDSVEDKRNQSGPNRGSGIQQVRLAFASVDNGQGGAACVVHG